MKILPSDVVNSIVRSEFDSEKIMFKNIKISNLVYEMLLEVSKKQRPQTKPEALVERLIKDLYSNTK